jgi:hypothetical protein
VTKSLSPLFALISLTAALGCSGSSGSGWGEVGFSDSFECGSSTCSAEQICLQTEPAPYAPQAQTVYECVAPPADCKPSSLCDCDYPDPYAGKQVVGCSVLGERTLRLADVSCGGAPCAEGQLCLVRAQLGTAITAQTPATCVELPTGCTLSQDFCSTTCPGAVAAEAGGVFSGCASAEWTAGVWIEPT